jgi:hypothetical protein
MLPAQHRYSLTEREEGGVKEMSCFVSSLIIREVTRDIRKVTSFQLLTKLDMKKIIIFSRVEVCARLIGGMWIG